MNKIASTLTLLIFGTWIGAEEQVTIGMIDFYGLRSVTEEEVRLALPFSEGFVLSADHVFSEEEAEFEIASALNVPRVDLSLVCCYEPYKAMAYVGIDEMGPAPVLQFPTEPTGNAVLPAVLDLH